MKKSENLINGSYGVITTKQTGTQGIHREYLREFVRQGKLERVKHGINITPLSVEGRYGADPYLVNILAQINLSTFMQNKQ